MPKVDIIAILIIDSVYHLQHINSLHRVFKRWLMPFNGVSTKETYITRTTIRNRFIELT